MTQELRLSVGLPASGKSTIAQKYKDLNYSYFSRDELGGLTSDSLGLCEESLKSGNSVYVDNSFQTVESRKPFVELAKKYNVKLSCDWVATSKEDCSINALHRMWDRYGRLFLKPEDFKDSEIKDDPNIFPIAAIFKSAKNFEKPAKIEGYDELIKYVQERKPHPDRTNSAYIFDYDGTLRDTTNPLKYPTHPSEISILPGRKEKLAKLDGMMFGVSNQSGIHKGNLTKEEAEACFNRTNELLEKDIKYLYCPCGVPPRCYCRKPQSGLGVYLIRQYNLDPKKCTFVGDLTSDRTFAHRLGMKFVDAEDFF